MATSIEKIHALAARYAGAPPPDVGTLELAFRSAVVGLGPLFLEAIPDDPGFLDEGLENMAATLLQLRSDHLAPVQISAGQSLLAPGEL